jgi:dienelactone hydrolase
VAPATPKTGIRWSQTAAPQGVDVPGAQWLKIEGAGGRSTNVQVAAVLRPQGPGPFPLVVWFHGGLGLTVDDVSTAARLTAGGFMVLVGCWRKTPAEAAIVKGVSYQRIPCLKILIGEDDASRALIEVGHQLPGVKKDAIGLFGVSAGGLRVLQNIAGSTDIAAVVVDSSPSGPSKVNAPVLMLGGTADSTLVTLIGVQQAYEQTLRNSGSTVEAYYYPGGDHLVTMYGDFQEDAIKRTIEFFRRYLK